MNNLNTSTIFTPNFKHYIEVVKLYSKVHRNHTYGKILYKVLKLCDPKLAKKIKGSKLDPRYTNDPLIISKFFKKVQTKWDQYEN